MCDLKHIQAFSFPDLIIYSVSLHFSDTFFEVLGGIQPFMAEWGMNKGSESHRKVLFSMEDVWKRHQWLLLAIMWQECSIFVLSLNCSWLSTSVVVKKEQDNKDTTAGNSKGSNPLCTSIVRLHSGQGAVHILCTITIKYLCLLAKWAVRMDQRPLNLDWRTLSRLPPDAPLDTCVNWRFETWLLTLLSGHLLQYIQPERN